MICYKVLINTLVGYITPFRLIEVSVPGSINAVDKNSMPLYDRMNLRFKVKGEGVHAFCAKESAESCAKESEACAVIAECTIPAGTEYWLGQGGTSQPGI